MHSMQAAHMMLIMSLFLRNFSRSSRLYRNLNSITCPSAALEPREKLCECVMQHFDNRHTHTIISLIIVQGEGGSL